MLRQLLGAALSIAGQEIRAELRARRARGKATGRTPDRTTPVQATVLCQECGREHKRTCPKCGRYLCGRCGCPCRHTPAQSIVVTRTPTVTPAPSQMRPPQAFSVNHRVGLGTVAAVQWHAIGQCWTYLLRWSNGASAWLLERDLLRYTRINP